MVTRSVMQWSPRAISSACWAKWCPGSDSLTGCRSAAKATVPRLGHVWGDPLMILRFCSRCSFWPIYTAFPNAVWSAAATATCLPSVFWVSQPPRSHLAIAPCQSARLAMPIDCASLRVLPGMSPLHEGDRGALDSRQVGFIRGSLSARGSSPWGEHDARRHVRSAQPATFCETGQ